jgi:hypothetical protein
MPILIGSHVRSGSRQGEVINYHAVAIGAGQYRCVEDAVWAGCILDDREAKPIGEAA